ncbi:hypothetical protein Tco_1311886 [Tanacetum coccineum]
MTHRWPLPDHRPTVVDRRQGEVNIGFMGPCPGIVLAKVGSSQLAGSVDVNLPTPMPKPQSPLKEPSQENPPTTQSNYDSIQSHSLPLGDSCKNNVLPPRTAKEIVAKVKIEKSKEPPCHMALPEDHLAIFHKMKDAKEMRRDAWNSGNKDGSRTGQKEDSKALVTVDGEGVDWTTHSEEEDYALMACNSSDSDTKDYPHRALKNKGIVDSGCSRHMTGNKAYLDEFQDFNGGPVAFGGSRGYITGKDEGFGWLFSTKQGVIRESMLTYMQVNKKLTKMQIKKQATGTKDEAEALRKKFVRPWFIKEISTASPYEGLTLANPTHSEEDDSEIPPLEDIY